MADVSAANVASSAAPGSGGPSSAPAAAPSSTRPESPHSYMTSSPSSSAPRGSVQEHRQSFTSTPQTSQAQRLPPVSSPYLQQHPASPGRTSAGSIAAEATSILQRPSQSAQDQQQHLNHQSHPHHQQQSSHHPERLPSLGFDRPMSHSLPPIISPLPPGLSYGPPNSDHRQPPISPRTIPPNFSIGDALQNVEAISGDATAPRKRSKVSRACDECRRKKIRCDATSESGIERCSSCKRVGSKCSFSRIPMKRGPSKGYIKELADRLNTLENSISTGDIHSYASSMPGEGELSPQTMEATSPTPGSAGLPKRKRTLSASSDFHGPVHLQPLTQHSPARRSSERLPPIDSFHPQQHPQMAEQRPHSSSLSHVPAPAHPLHPATQSPPVTASDVSTPFRSQPSPNGIFWKGRLPDFGGEPRRSSSNFPYEGSRERERESTSNANSEHPKPAIGYAHAATSFDWNDDAVNDYYDFIHPTLPLLPHSKSRLRSRLAAAPPPIRDALLEALYSAVRSCPGSRGRVDKSPALAPRRVSDLAFQSQFDDYAVKTFPTTILQLQTLVLMVLEADSHGPGKMLGLTGPPRGAWLGAAIGLAYSLRLHQSPGHAERRQSGHAEDLDADEMMMRRAWWVLVMLDRWHAVSTQSPLMIPDSSIRLNAQEDETSLGSGPYHIARLSLILGHLAEAASSTPDALSPATLSPYTHKLLRGELDRFREGLESIWSHDSAKTIRAAYYHVKLLLLRQNPTNSSPDEILDTALRITRLLENPDSPTLILQHHFATLTLTSLLDLSSQPPTRDGAWTGLQQLLDWAERRLSFLSPSHPGKTWERTVKEVIERRKQGKYNPQGSYPTYGTLEHFAELEGGRSPRSGPVSGEGLHEVDAGRVCRQGYLGGVLL